LHNEGDFMDSTYWIGRKRVAMGMAREAATSEARLIHYELAGRYSIKAAHQLFLARSGHETAGGSRRAVLHLPQRDPSPCTLSAPVPGCEGS
jgi:hypothetical protein